MPTKITTNQYGTHGSNGAYGNPDGTAGGTGGIGYSVAGSTVYNYAAIYGGYGGNGGNGGNGGAGGSAGAGVDISAGTLVNETGASIRGGYGGTGGTAVSLYGSGGNAGSGGTGVTMSGSSTLTNTGSITGYGGGYGGDYIGYRGSGGSGGNGGTGVLLNGGTLNNNSGGSIIGGNGGYGGAYVGGSSAYGVAGRAGSGGTGVVLNGGTLNNNSGGSITGGRGGPNEGGPGSTGGAGGAGVYLNGGTLVTSGIISGGAGGGGGAAAGDAVRFGSVASSLIVEPGAVFNGQVAANSSVNDVLRLRGTEAAATTITLGTQFTNFSTLAFASGAHWTVDVSTGAAPSRGLAINGFSATDSIDVTNLTPTQVAADFNPSTHVLTTASDGTLHFAGISGDYFLFSSDSGAGTNITLDTGPIATTLLYTVTLGSASFPSPLTITYTGVVSPAIAGATGVVSNSLNNSLTNNGAIHGGAGSNSSVGGIGGVGVNFKAGTTLTNTSSITGGTGGSGSSTTGGAGGAGVNLLAGTLTNRGNITGGTGGVGTTTGGHGGVGVDLNGGTLITSGTISGGQGGAGTPSGAAGDAVKFGSAASTLMVEPGALFNGHVVANASVNDVLELSGKLAGGTAIKLGTEFTNFSTLTFLSGAARTVDVGAHAAPSGGLAISGFTTSDTIDITNLTPTQVAADFDPSTDVIATTSDGTLTFNGVGGDTFVFTGKGVGTDVTVQPGAAATLAAAGHDLTNFVGDEHRALMGGQSMLGAHGFGSGSMQHTDPALETLGGHGFSANAFTDHGLAHESVMLR